MMTPDDIENLKSTLAEQYGAGFLCPAQREAFVEDYARQHNIDTSIIHEVIELMLDEEIPRETASDS
ncbi:MAG: hypothetical protein JWN98_1975 [Abditibacteriota bacterium]|nr:hypothetical protein [Abditibacteriota bacterium]